MHGLYDQAVGSMGPDEVNHVERPGVLPIAFSLFHYTNMEDVSFLFLTGTPTVWDAAWQTKVKMAVDDHGKERTVEEMVHQRIGDYEAFSSYQRAVFDRTEAHLQHPTRRSSDAWSCVARSRLRSRRPTRRGAPALTA